MAKSWTVREVLGWTKDYFRRSGIEAARLEAEILLSHVLRADRLELYLQPERVLTDPERLDFKKLIQQRHEGTPLQYLIGEVEFLGCRLKVSPVALIPRPETEELVERIVKDFFGSPIFPARILDLGTGTGAIAIALARAFQHAQILAVDLSERALGLASENARANGVEARVRFLQSDWYENVSGVFDLIVSNPPYIPREELEHLQTEVKREPVIALDGGPSGLEAIAHIVSRSVEFLRPQGRLYLEMGDTQASRVRELIEQTETFHLDILRDIAGKERFVRAERLASRNIGTFAEQQ